MRTQVCSARTTEEGFGGDGEVEQATLAPIRRARIIDRPRLTRRLDACGARIILLIAPAGYGKTTLAREWLRTRPHA